MEEKFEKMMMEMGILDPEPTQPEQVEITVTQIEIKIPAGDANGRVRI